jgi:hypothetical protein
MTIIAHCELMKSRSAPEAFRHLSAIRKAAASIAEIVGEGGGSIGQKLQDRHLT